MQINSTCFLAWNFAFFPSQDSNYSNIFCLTAFYFTVTLCIATSSVFICFTRHAKYFPYSCLGLLVHCLGLGLERHRLCIEPQCLGLGLEPHCLGLGTYCHAPITVPSITEIKLATTLTLRQSRKHGTKSVPKVG